VHSPDDESGSGSGGAAEGDAKTLQQQAEALAQEGRFSEAEAIYRSILRLVKKATGKDHPGYGAALYELSRVLSAQSKHAEAEGLLRRALALFETTPGVEHPPYEQTLHTLASVLGAQDKFKDAEDLLRAALGVQEKALGERHPKVGSTLTNLAIALVQQQRLSEAEPVVMRALAVVEEAHGEAHAETARILTIAAQIQAALGDEAASATARRALTALTATHGAEHPLVQDAKPILEDIAEPSAELDALLQEAAEALEARDPDRAVALLAPLVERARRDGLLPLEASASGMLAQAQYLSGRRGEAAALAHRALAIAEEAGQEDAVRHFRDLVEVIERGDTGPAIPEALQKQIQAAIETAQSGDVPAAVRALDRLSEEAQRANESGAEATLRIVLAQILYATGEADLAAVHLRRALEIAEEVGDRGAADHVRRMLEVDPGGPANGPPKQA
jgi:tetratricopeptide (TPR) repeat protein